jgi:hypothetical protein
MSYFTETGSLLSFSQKSAIEFQHKEDESSQSISTSLYAVTALHKWLFLLNFFNRRFLEIPQLPLQHSRLEPSTALNHNQSQNYLRLAIYRKSLPLGGKPLETHDQ